MKIITLTLNPAFDMHCYVDKFLPFCENIADITSFEAGGKGVNISRALSSNGVDNTAIIIVGKENLTEYTKQLKKDGVNYKTIEVEGRIRENVTLHSGDGSAETRISFKGFKCNNEVLKAIKNGIGKVDGETIVTLTGSIPEGIDINEVKNLLIDLKKEGAKTVIDSRSFTLNDIAGCGAWLVKPNEYETKVYTGICVNSENDGAIAAKKIYEAGVENAVVSLGAKGAVIACKEGVFVASTPQVKVNSTIGAGDSMIAGFISECSNIKERIKSAVAFGTAACMQKGTRPPQPQDIKNIKEKITVKRII